MNKSFSKNLRFIWIIAVLFLLSCQENQSTAPPNIIVFLVDDMGWQDTSVPFWDSVTPANQKFRTPNMERLAEKGIKFTNAYANSVCTPSRVSMITGMNAARHKVTNWTMYKEEKVDPVDSILEAPNWNTSGLSPKENIPNTVYATPLFQLLKDHGYFTIHSGKAHFGAHDTPGEFPENLGADINIAGSAAGNPASYFGEKKYGNVEGEYRVRAVPGLEKYWGSSTFLSEAITLEALKAIDSAQSLKKPFFLNMSHYAVHLPFDADPRFYENYRKKRLNESEAAYAALVEGMDHSLGQILDYLEEKNLENNTVILFMSDNGGLSHAPRTGEIDTQNYPLRYGKGSFYEGGIREPMLVYWPGVTPANTQSHQPVAIWDYFPTILEMAGIKDPQVPQTVDGISFVDQLKDPDKTDKNRVLISHFPNHWGGDQQVEGYSFTSAIRKGDWKLIYIHRLEELRLYNLKEDIHEKHNLAETHPEKLKELAQLLTQRFKEANAQLPFFKDSGKKVAWPADVLAR